MTRERVLKLPVLEIFGPTFQGEGRAIGQKTMFVRTAGCDYHCDWCDSARLHGLRLERLGQKFLELVV